jgi:hypothetical protein
VTTRGRGKLQGSINTSELVGHRKWSPPPLSRPATSALSSRSQDDVDSDISRFKLLLPLRPESGAAADVASSFPERTKSPAWRLRERPFLPCIENLALHRIFLGGELRQRATQTKAWSLPPRWIMTTRSTGKAWFYLSRFVATIFLFFSSSSRIEFSLAFWTWLNQPRDGSPTSAPGTHYKKGLQLIGTIFSQGRRRASPNSMACSSFLVWPPGMSLYP